MTSSRPVAAPLYWSSRFAFYVGAAGAAVGLGSIWRFPYLAGTSGGSAFILVFVVACLLIATPLLAAEFALGRRSGRSPPEAAGEIASSHGLSRRWNVIGLLGALAAFLIFSYYTVIAGWVLAYAWKSASGALANAGSTGVAAQWQQFLSQPLQVGAWHAAFVVLAAAISARGLDRGIETVNKFRGPALLVLLCILAVYSLATGNVRRGLSFAFTPDFAAIDSSVMLAAIGQAFYATGVGQAMMIAYGAYARPGTSLVRSSLAVTGSILLVSLLATVIVFPLVFGYGMNPAQGSQLVFEVLPRAFVEMPGGRAIGTLFFILLVLAALMPSIASIEPAAAWLVQRGGMRRSTAVWATTFSAWLLGLGSVLSFNLASQWRPLGFIPALAAHTFFDVMNYVTSDILLPVGALLTSVFMGWRLREVFADELRESTSFARRCCVWLLRYVCPLAILLVFAATLI